jgi:hypothetical protein
VYRAGTPNVPPVTGRDAAPGLDLAANAGPLDLAADAGPPLEAVIARTVSTVSNEIKTLRSDRDLIANFPPRNGDACLDRLAVTSDGE